MPALELLKYRSTRDAALALVAKGEKKGRKMGRAEGRSEGQRELILFLLAKRFGPVPEWARERLRTATEEELQDIGLRMGKASSIRAAIANGPTRSRN